MKPTILIGEARNNFNMTYGKTFTPHEKLTARRMLFAHIEACGYDSSDLDIVLIRENPISSAFDAIRMGSYASDTTDYAVETINRHIKTTVEAAVGASELRHTEERAKLVADAASLREEVTSLKEQLAKRA